MACTLERTGMDAKAFGTRLRRLREEARLTQTELANRAGVKRNAIVRWEAEAGEEGQGEGRGGLRRQVAGGRGRGRQGTVAASQGRRRGAGTPDRGGCTTEATSSLWIRRQRPSTPRRPRRPHPHQHRP